MISRRALWIQLSGFGAGVFFAILLLSDAIYAALYDDRFVEQGLASPVPSWVVSSGVALATTALACYFAYRSVHRRRM